ncbi:LINE-1 reverse transcriptase homolog [Plakobranchus ocellatus]|uniref:LINE-1 reverse transcriptase homolog n=1 Tax=Plakobranchus ocellatus TaxID=259542 RepID=A0AAV4CM49_9GAST|nr:LINE-1 reverse transcriptase homolog [Plakobranchus ocellatus]
MSGVTFGPSPKLKTLEKCREWTRLCNHPQTDLSVDKTGENNELYNNPFLLSELNNSINKSNESAAGPHGVYYQFLRHLPESCLHILFKLFNNIWTTGDIPPSCREASVIPIPKPDKDPPDPSDYRPIERMVNHRLVQVLESRNLLSKENSFVGSDLKPTVNVYIHTIWQENWDAEGASKLQEVFLNLGEDLSRKGEGAGKNLETIMCRLRMGHIWLTQSNLLKMRNSLFPMPVTAFTLSAYFN